jgi:hypothetical protein
VIEYDYVVGVMKIILILYQLFFLLGMKEAYKKSHAIDYA